MSEQTADPVGEAKDRLVRFAMRGGLPAHEYVDTEEAMGLLAALVAEVDRLRKRRAVRCPDCKGSRRMGVNDWDPASDYACPRCRDEQTGASTGAILE